MTCIYREYFSYFEKTVVIACKFRVFLQFCITGVDRTFFLWFLKATGQILRVQNVFACIVLKS